MLCFKEIGWSGNEDGVSKTPGADGVPTTTTATTTTSVWGVPAAATILAAAAAAAAPWQVIIPAVVDVRRAVGLHKGRVKGAVHPKCHGRSGGCCCSGGGYDTGVYMSAGGEGIAEGGPPYCARPGGEP